MQHLERILILDFGSQYTQLIARRVRELGVFSEIKPFSITPDEVKLIQPRGIILSGGPASVYSADAPLPDPALLNLGIPVLGICYGLQVIAHQSKGEVGRAPQREYGRAELEIDASDILFEGLGEAITVWMSHGDHINRVPPGFVSIAHTANAPVAAIRHQDRPLYGIQFHPEVVHTPRGSELLGNFVLKICGCRGDWNAHSFIDNAVADIRAKAGQARVICALSGGVDSTVAAALVGRAIGRQLTCIFVDTGLLREGEAEEVCSF